MSKRKELRTTSRMVLILSLVLLIAVTAGVSYAVFNYTNIGSKANEVTTSNGTITVFYDSMQSENGNIVLTDYSLITDVAGKHLTTIPHILDFNLSATVGENNVPYEITVRKKGGSTYFDSAVKVYLVELFGGEEKELPLTLNGNDVRYYSELNTSSLMKDAVSEKTIYQGMIPANATEYEKSFRLKLWIAEDSDFSMISNEEMEPFSLTVSIYSNAAVVEQGL